MTTDPQELVESFYRDVWNEKNEKIAREILHNDFRFRGSLGPEHRGPDGFIGYMRSVHRALGNYTCVIEGLVTSEHQAAARMIFKGIHRAEFFGVAATGKEITWAGAAFFQMAVAQITDLWVLGDIDHIKQQLEIETATKFNSS